MIPTVRPALPSSNLRLGRLRPSVAVLPGLVAAALALASLTGCAEDKLVCDDDGCFRCDGLGCRPAQPDQPGECLTNDDCDPGAICTISGCVDACTDDEDCPDGLVCREAGDDGRRLCVPRDEPAPVCVRNEDCMASGVECRDGLCVPSDLCEAEDDCADGEACIDGRCRPDDDVCRFNRECADGRVCVDGRCVAECAGDDDCVEGEVCDLDTGFCTPAPPPPPGTCTRDADCGDGEVCTDSRCVDGCRDDADCGEGRVCTPTLVCIPDTTRDVFCADDSDCRRGSACVDGICRIPCDDSDFCQRVAAEIPFCFEGFCASSNEATTDCARNADCPDGEICEDGVCRR